MLEHGVMFSLHIFKASSDMNIAVFECFSAREKKKKFYPSHIKRT